MDKIQRTVVGIFVLFSVFTQHGCVTVNLLEPPGPVQEVQLSGSGEGKVLLLDLSGVISSQDKEGWLPQPNLLATFKEELTKASKDEKVKAVVVKINSPGGTVNAKGLLEKVGVEANAITSGPRKDMGSPFRSMTADEKEIFQGVIDSFYQRFLTVVQAGRPQLSAEQIKKLADGRIYSGDQAKAAGVGGDIPSPHGAI